MATALAAQLAQLAAAQPPTERYVRGKASLLYDYQAAADVGAETLLGIAQAGLATLTKADKRFSPFADSLFGADSVSISREQLTQAENEALDANLTAFLRVLTSHFLAPAAFQVLEYCVRRYRVHVFNVNELLLCALPYHATPEFARLVALLALQDTPWQWLAPAQQSGAPPPRDVIVRRCVNDMAALRAVCAGAQSLGAAGFVSKTYLSFYAVLLCEVLAAVPRVTEDLLTLLLPFVAAGLRPAASREYRSATLMVLTQLLAHAQLSSDFLAVVLVEVVGSWADLGGSTVVMMLAHLATTQPHCSSLPLKALQGLAEHRETAQEVAALQRRRANLDPLLALLLPSLTAHLPSHPALAPLLGDLLTGVTLHGGLVQASAVQLLLAGAAAAGDSEQQEALRAALRVFDVHHPAQLDAAINAALQQAAAAAPAAPAGDPPGDEGGKARKKKKAAGKEQQASDAMFEFVQLCFAGGRHEVLPAGTAAAEQQAALTLSLAACAPASELRLLALQKLDAVCSQELLAGGAAGAGGPGSMQQLLQTSLLSGLRDDVFAVATAAASAQGLALVPAGLQLPALADLLQRAAAAIATGHAAAAAGASGDAEQDGGGKAGGAKEALKAAKVALAAVAAAGERAAEAAAAGGDAADAAAVQQRAAALLLEYALGDKRTKKLAKAAVRAALRCAWSPVLQALADAPGVAAALDGAEGAAAAAAAAQADGGRRRKGIKQGAGDEAAEQQAPAAHTSALDLNRAVVAALADAAAGDDGVLQHVAAMLRACGPRCRHLLLLSLAKLAAAGGPSGSAGAEATPAKGKGKGGARAGGKGGKSGGGAAAGSAGVAAVLVAALEQQLGAAGSKKQKGGGGLQLPADWTVEAQQLLDASALPTKQHMQQLAGQPLQELSAMVLLTALHAALTAASAVDLAAALGQPVQLFARLAAAAAVGPKGGSAPSSGLLEHLRLLVERSGESDEQRLAFLSGIYGLPPALAGKGPQVVALQLLPRVAGAAAAAAAGGGGAGSGAWLVRLLAAANGSDRAVRAAAADALAALPEAVAGAGSRAAAWALPGGFSAQHLQGLCSGLQQQAALLKGSAGALAQLLAAALPNSAAGEAAMDVDGASPPAAKGRKKGKAAAGNPGKASTQSGEPAAALQLPGECAAALLQLLLATLAENQEPADLLGARLAASVLAAAGAEPAAAAAAVQQLLQHLAGQLCQLATAAGGDGGAWQQLVDVAQGPEAQAAAAAALQQLRTDVAVSLLQFFTPEVLAEDAGVAAGFVQLLQLPYSAAAGAALLAAAGAADGGDLGRQLAPAQLAALAPIRAAALLRLTPAAFQALPPQQRQAAFTAALQALASDGDAACRSAARQCLAQLPVTAAMLLALLQPAAGASAPSPQQQQQQQRSKRAKRATSSSGSQQEPGAAGLEGQGSGALAGAPGGAVTAAALDAAVAALEFLQWRDDLYGRQQLLQPLQALLRQVAPLMGSIAEAHAAQEASAGVTDGVGEAGVSPSAAGYAAQLCLLLLERLAREQLAAGEGPQQGAGAGAAGAAATAGGAIDVDLVLGCASAAPDGAARNAALLLMAVLAQLAPADVLDHVLKALAVIHHSAALQGDAHSQAVASSTLAALVPAWLAGGRGSQELWLSLLSALPGLPALRRVGLLEALLCALPQDQGLRVGLLLMMQRLAEHSAAKKKQAAAAAAAPLDSPATPDSSKQAKKARKQASAADADAAAAAAAAAGAASEQEDEGAWLPDLMASLCEKVPVQQRLDAFAAVLEASLSGPQGPVAAHAHLPRLAVAFVAANLKAKSVAATLAAASAAAAAGDAGEQARLQQACKAVMAQALAHLLALNPGAAAAAADAEGGKAARRTARAVGAAADGVYGLLAALEAVMDCGSYLLALVEMTKQPSDSVQRRALRLLAARLGRCEVDLADAAGGEEGGAEVAAARSRAQLELAEAGLAVCAQLPRLLAAPTPPITQQLALVAADAGMRTFGALMPAVVFSSLLTLLGALQSPSAPVRASALACVAAGARALGPQLVSLLPPTAGAVLDAAEAAVRDLEAAEQQDGSSSDSDSDSEDGDEEQPANQADEAALQLAGAVSALEALVTGLGAFMSPYLPRVLRLLLCRQVLGCGVAGTNAAAGRLRCSLPAKVPARLLAEPVVGQWDAAVAACGGAAGGVDAAPAVTLLDLVAVLAGSLEPAVAAAYHEQLAGLLLQALDTRRRWLASGGADGAQQAAAAAALHAAAALDDDGGSAAAAAAAAVAAFGPREVNDVEAAAVRALAALVMKLSEAKFKPMFLRMLDWGNAGGAQGGEQQGAGRMAALFAAVCALAQRLRGVFVPYSKYFMVQLMRQLAGEAGAGGGGGSKRSKKKRKMAAAAAAADGAGAEGGAVDGALLSAWLARLRAVRAVHLLALHEAPPSAPADQQAQQERFEQLLPLLVEVLQDGPPLALAPLLAEQGADAGLDPPGGPRAALGAVGQAVDEAGAGPLLVQACDSVGLAAVGALLQLAVAGGSDVVWKPLHHALLIATRGGSARAKLLALGCVSRLVEALREEYLMLLPEALPFIAELVEDGEVGVEAAAQGLVAQLEVLSGERLEQYLKA